VADYRQYRLYLDEANRFGPKWRLAYMFREFYDVGDMEYGTMASVVERYKSDWSVA